MKQKACRAGLVLVIVVTGILYWKHSARAATADPKVAPATVAKIEGTDRKRVTLQPDAARRLDIQTAPVREEVIHPTKQVVGGVIGISTELNAAIVRVELTESEVSRVQRDEPAFVLPLARDSQPSRLKAVPLSGAIAKTLSIDSKARRIKALPLRKTSASGLSEVPGTIHYEVSAADHGLVNRQLVQVELSLTGGGEKRRVIPTAAVLYSANGKTWVYANPEPLVYIREPIQIDTISGDEVVLADGPAAGTAVVTVGGAELYGTEFGVGK